MKSRILSSLTFLLLGALAALSLNSFIWKADMPKVHKLQQPLIITGGDPDQHVSSILPKGTSMYFDQAFPEGFVRYKVYVNVEGIKLESSEVTEEFWIDPLTAFPVDKDQLLILLKKHPLTKEDLASILRSGNLSKQEIQETLNEYSK